MLWYRAKLTRLDLSQKARRILTNKRHKKNSALEKRGNERLRSQLIRKISNLYVLRLSAMGSVIHVGQTLPRPRNVLQVRLGYV